MFSRTSSTSLTGAGPLTGLEWASDRRGPKCPREVGCRAAPLQATQPPCPCRRSPPPPHAPGEGPLVCRMQRGRAQRQGGSPVPYVALEPADTLSEDTPPQDNFLSCFGELQRVPVPATPAAPPSAMGEAAEEGPGCKRSVGSRTKSGASCFWQKGSRGWEDKRNPSAAV